MQLRAMLGELSMPSISSMFPIPSIAKTLTEVREPVDRAQVRRFARFAAEFEWYAAALREARQKGVLMGQSAP